MKPCGHGKPLNVRCIECEIVWHSEGRDNSMRRSQFHAAQVERLMLERAMTPAERRAMNRKAPAKGLHAAPMGTGPATETCGSCAHLYRHAMAKPYLKCELCRPMWTGGGGTDVRAKDLACSKWTPKTEDAGK